MKTLIASALMLLAPTLALAQTTSEPAKAAPKAAAKPAAKAAKADAPAKKTSAAKPKAADKTTVAKAKPTSSRTQLKSATSQVASGIMAAEAALTPEELAISDKVHTGRIACELGAFVNVEADAASPGRFNVEGKGFKYRMTPVATTTGAIRLEDQTGGAVWLQIANKSMLMNQKIGQRLADECMSPQQLVVAEAIKKNPPRSVLEPADPK